MFIRTVLSFIIILISYCSFAQKGNSCPEDLFPKRSENKQYGYVNFMGEWRIQPIYTKVSPYANNKAIVMKGLSYGVIDCEGNVLIQCQYEQMTNFRYGKVWAKKAGLWGLLDEKGKTLIEFQYSEIAPINTTEMTWVKKEDLWGLVNEEKGNFICKPQYNSVQTLSSIASMVQVGDKFGFINNLSCYFVVPAEITKVKKLAPNTITYRLNNKWGLFSEYGKILHEPEYDTIFVKHEDILQMKKETGNGLLTLQGKEVLSPVYEVIGDYSEGYLPVKSNGLYGYCTRSGAVYIKPQYLEAYPFKNKKAVVKTSNGYGIIDITNKFIMNANVPVIERNLKFDFYSMSEKTDKGPKYFFYNSELQKISIEGFDSIIVADTASFVRVVRDGKWKYYDVNSRQFSFLSEFDNCSAFAYGYAIAGAGGKLGVVDIKGKAVVPAIFDSVHYHYFSNKMVFNTWSGDKSGIYETTGKELLKCEFEEIVAAGTGVLKVKKSGKWGIMKTNGTYITEPKYDQLSIDTPEWPAMAQMNGKIGIVNEKGEEILAIKYHSVKYLGDNYYAVSDGKAFGLYLYKGPEPKCKYDEILAFGAGLAPVKKGKTWGYINTRGEYQLPANFESADVFINRMAVVKQNGLYGVIDPSGKFIVKPEFSDFINNNGERVLIKDDIRYLLRERGVLKKL
ncbi:MAG: WG repeat-containing protein [Cytophagaceae bacterium]